MEKFIEKNDDGTLTEHQTEQFMLQIASTIKETFRILGEMEVKDILEAHRNPSQCAGFTKAVGKAFEKVVEADMPQAFNDYLGEFSKIIVEKAFVEINEKNQENLITMIETSTGLDYGDMSPKDIIEYIVANKKTDPE